MYAPRLRIRTILAFQCSRSWFQHSRSAFQRSTSVFQHSRSDLLKWIILINRFGWCVVSAFVLQVNLCQKLFFLQNMGRTCCVQKLFWMSETISVHKMFSPGLSLEFLMCWTCNSMNNLSSYYCHIIDAKIRASDKDLTVPHDIKYIIWLAKRLA